MNTVYYLIGGLILTVLALLCFNAVYYSEFETVLSEGIYLQAGDKDLSVPNWSVPLVYDWNGDGRKDLLVGRHSRDRKRSAQGKGYISFFANMGTDASPLFNDYHNIQICTDICTPLSVRPSG